MYGTNEEGFRTLDVWTADGEHLSAAQGEVITVEIPVGPPEPDPDVAAWLIAEARWYATKLGALLDVELGSDSVKHLVCLHLDDPRPDWAPGWLPEEKG